MGNIYIPNGSFLKSSGNDNGYVVEAKNVKGLEEFIREIIGQTPPTTYTVACNVTYGSKTPTGSQTVESGGSVSWTISPNSGYQMPTSVSGAIISGNTVTVRNVTSNKTINVVCTPEVEIISLNWSGMSISPSSNVQSNQSVTLTKGNITLNYSDGTSTNVTNNSNITFSLYDNTITIDDEPANFIKSINNTNSSTVVFTTPATSVPKNYKIAAKYSNEFISRQFIVYNVIPEQVVPVITLNPSSNQTVTAATTVSATVTNGTAANTSWSITNSGTSGNTFKLSASTGASVTVTPNNTTAPTANKGTVSMNTSGQTSQNENYGTRQLSSSFTQGQTATTTYETTVTASYTGATPKSVKLTYSKSTSPLSAGTYTWSVVSGKSLPTGVSFSAANQTTTTSQGNTVQLYNYNSDTVTIPAGTIQVSNTNATAAVSNSSAFTIPAKTEQITYYWYVGHENPMNMSSITALSSNDASAGAGWRTIGTTLPTYTKNSPLWGNMYGTISTASSKSTQYMALPSSNIKSRNDITGEDITSDGWNTVGTKTLSGVTYTVYSSVNTKKSFMDTLY